MLFHECFSPDRQRGFSIVELMVAMVIGLVSILVLMQVGVSFEEQKRSTVGGSGAVDSSGVALNQLRRELSLAGNGLNHADVIGCSLTVYRAANASVLTETLLPVRITKGTNGASDMIEVRAGDIRRFVETGLFSDHIGDVSPYVTDNNYGFMQGDAFIVVQPSANPCVIGEVSAAATNTTNVAQAAAGTRFNKPGGSGIAFSALARLINLGPNPLFSRFSVSGTTLQRLNQLTLVTEDLLQGVMLLQAQYGFATVANGLVWSNTVMDADGDGTAGDDDDWLRLNAVRVAVVVRQEQMEKPDSEGNCSTTGSSVTWSFGSYAVTGDAARCYRYRVAETVVPLRNLIWSPQ